MRVKQLWPHFDVLAKANLVWSRITFSRLTTIYFALACVHCAIQVIFQIQAFSINAAAANSLWSRMVAAGQTQEDQGFAVLGDDLRICYSLPKSITVESCSVIWKGTNHSGPPYGIAAASVTSLNAAPTSRANAAIATIPGASTAPPSSSVTRVATSSSVLSASRTASSPSSVTTSSPVPSLSTSISTSASSIPLSASPIITPASSSAPKVTLLITDPNANSQRPTGVGAVVIDNGHADDKDDHEDEDDHDDHEDDHDNLHLALHDTRRSVGSKRADVNLDETCIGALIWPVQRLSDTKREDITFIGFQFWVLGMSVVALLNESIPHTVAALVTHLLATIWAIYQIFDTERFRGRFSRLITNGACKPNNLLGSYWEQRRNAEISSAVLNGVALLASAFLTYKLVKIYGWQTFKRVGASLTINRIYRLVLSLSISIQLALFFIISAMALWIDQLYNGSIGRLATESKVYKITFIVVFCLLIPWLSLGWFSVRRENRRTAFVFLILSLLFIGLWGAMFDSTSFRWTFVTWPFFTMMAIIAGILMISTFILGLASRLNFGKGLPRYLNAEEPLDGGDFTPVYTEKMGFGEDDPEKVEFPSSDGRPVPTFSAAFGHGIEVPKPTQMHFGPQRAPGTSMYGGTTQEQPGHAIGRSISSTSSHSGRSEHSLTRNDTFASHKSSSSTSSGRSDGMGKRWVIE